MVSLTTNAASEREMFEAWCVDPQRDLYIERLGLGYFHPVTSMLWECWQAARRTPAAERAARNQAIDECCAAIKAADDREADDDYMLDSDDCIAVLRALKTALTAAQLAALERMAANAQELGLYDMPTTEEE